MGSPHVVLAILSFVLVFTVIASSVYIATQAINVANNTPVLKVYSDAYVNPETGETILKIIVKHERGNPVTLRYVEISTEKGLVILDKSSFKIRNCKEQIMQGITCAYENTSRGLFVVGKTYSGLVYFSEGSYPVVFTPVYTYLPPSSNRPFYNTTFVGLVVKVDVAVSNLLANTTSWALQGAWLNPAEDGNVVVIYLGNSTAFGSMGFVYRYDLNIEFNLTQGAWLISAVKLNGSIPGKWGFGVFFDFKTDQPEEKLVFMGIDVDQSNRSHLVIELYERKETGQSITLIASTPINIPLTRLIDEKFLLASYIKADLNANRYNITVFMYDTNLNIVATTSTVNYPVRLPGTPGETWSHRASLIVYNTTAMYEFLVLTRNFTAPFIKIRGLPADYIVEIYGSEGTLIFRAVSTGGDAVLPFVYLDAGSIIIVKYPSIVGEPLAFYYVLEQALGVGCIVELINVIVNTNSLFNSSIAEVYVKLPVGNGTTNITGLIAVDLLNRNTIPIKTRLILVKNYSYMNDLTLSITLIDSSGCELIENPIVIDDYEVINNVTTWTTRLIKPGEVVYLYIKGYFHDYNKTARIVLYLETYGVDPETQTIVNYDYRPVVLNLSS